MGDVYANNQLIAREGRTSGPIRVNVNGREYVVQVLEHDEPESGGYASVKVETAGLGFGGDKIFSPDGLTGVFHGVPIRHERG